MEMDATTRVHREFRDLGQIGIAADGEPWSGANVALANRIASLRRQIDEYGADWARAELKGLERRMDAEDFARAAALVERGWRA